MELRFKRVKKELRIATAIMLLATIIDLRMITYPMWMVMIQFSLKCLSTISRIDASDSCNKSGAKNKITNSMPACVASLVLLCSGAGNDSAPL